MSLMPEFVSSVLSQSPLRSFRGEVVKLILILVPVWLQVPVMVVELPCAINVPPLRNMK